MWSNQSAKEIDEFHDLYKRLQLSDCHILTFLGVGRKIKYAVGIRERSAACIPDMNTMA